MKTDGSGSLLLNPYSYAILGTVLCMLLQNSCNSEVPMADPVIRTARNMNARCPQMVDQMTRMDSVVVLADTTFQYYYTLINQLKNTIDIEGLVRFLEPSIIGNVRQNPGMNVQRNHKLTIAFSYYDMDGAFITTVTIRPEDYLD